MSISAFEPLANIEAAYARWGLSNTSWLDKIRAHVRLVRPTTRLWFDVLMPLAVLSTLTGGHPPTFESSVFIVVMTLVHIAATAVNDLQDVESDRLSPETLRSTRPIANGVISRDLAIIEALGMSLMAVAISALLSWKLALVCVLFCFLLLSHELPPLRTQSRPLLGQVAGMVGLTGIVAAIVMITPGATFVRETTPLMVFIALYLGFAEMLVKDIRDVDNDSLGGKHTTAVRFGPAKAAHAAVFAYLLAATAWIWFVATYPGLRLVPTSAGSVLFAVWIVCTVVLARRLEKGFSKAIGRSLHRGSVTVFALLMLGVIAATIR